MRNRWARTLAFGLVLAGWGTFSPAEAETVLKAITYAPLSKVEDSMVIFKKWVEKSIHQAAAISKSSYSAGRRSFR